MHISHNASYGTTKILNNLCFSFLPGITAVSRKIENNAYAKFWGADKVHYAWEMCKWRIASWFPERSVNFYLVLSRENSAVAITTLNLHFLL